MQPVKYGLDEYEWAYSCDWRTLVYNMLQRLGGTAHLSKMYDEYDKICRLSGRQVVRKPKQSIQATLEKNCPLSKKCPSNSGIFSMPEGKGTGVYSIDKQQWT
jgi:hypothetical protein